MTTQTNDRLDPETMTTVDGAMALIEGSYSATKVIAELAVSFGYGIPFDFLQVMDGKRLYGNRITELYVLCGRDPERFKYHVCVELPNQETGEVTINGPYFEEADDDFVDAFIERRMFWTEGSLWGLQDPPTELTYEYPIAH